MDLVLALALGVTLSAAAGFRVFIPPLIISLGAIYGDFPLAPGFAWLGTYPAAIAFGVAAVVEILAFYIPVVDNLLDAIEIPLAIAVGTFLTAAFLGDLFLALQGAIAFVAGGGTAGIISIFLSIARLGATGVTGGMGNFLIATVEALSAAVLSLLAMTVPLLAIGLVIGLLAIGGSRVRRSFPSFWRKITNR